MCLAVLFFRNFTHVLWLYDVGTNSKEKKTLERGLLYDMLGCLHPHFFRGLVGMGSIGFAEPINIERVVLELSIFEEFK